MRAAHRSFGFQAWSLHKNHTAKRFSSELYASSSNLSGMAGLCTQRVKRHCVWARLVICISIPQPRGHGLQPLPLLQRLSVFRLWQRLFHVWIAARRRRQRKDGSLGKYRALNGIGTLSVLNQHC